MEISVEHSSLQLYPVFIVANVEWWGAFFSHDAQCLFATANPSVITFICVLLRRLINDIRVL